MLSVIIPSYNEEQMVERAYNTISDILRKADIENEIIEQASEKKNENRYAEHSFRSARTAQKDKRCFRSVPKICNYSDYAHRRKNLQYGIMRHSGNAAELKYRIGEKSVKSISEDGRFFKGFNSKPPERISSVIRKSTFEIITEDKLDFTEENDKEEKHSANSDEGYRSELLFIFSDEAGYNNRCAVCQSCENERISRHGENGKNIG